MSASTACERHGSWRRPGPPSPTGPSLLHYRQWQDEVVLFNEISGATHLLSLEALTVLERLAAGPAPDAELAAALRERFDVDEDTLAEELADLLEQLSSLDLVEPCPA